MKNKFYTICCWGLRHDKASNNHHKAIIGIKYLFLYLGSCFNDTSYKVSSSRNVKFTKLSCSRGTSSKLYGVSWNNKTNKHSGGFSLFNQWIIYKFTFIIHTLHYEITILLLQSVDCDNYKLCWSYKHNLLQKSMSYYCT